MDSVGAVMQQQMDKTLAGLNDKLGALEHRVSGTVRTVKDSVNTVRDTFDVKLQVRRRPWALLAGAAALGFFGGFRSSSRGTERPGKNGKNDSTHPPGAAVTEPPCAATNNGTNGADAAGLSAAAAPGWGAKWGSRLQPEIAALRGIAVGALLELVREVITRPTSRPVAGPTREAGKGPNGKSGVRAAPRRVPMTRRKAHSRLHPLEGVSDGKTVRRPR